jgi:hypothetical protein
MAGLRGKRRLCLSLAEFSYFADIIDVMVSFS